MSGELGPRAQLLADTLGAFLQISIIVIVISLGLGLVRVIWRSPESMIEECRAACPGAWSANNITCSCSEAQP